MPDYAQLVERIRTVCGAAPIQLSPLSGGCVGDVFRADLPEGSRVVVKSADREGALDIEGFMLRYLTERSVLPVPRVMHAGPDLLVMEYIEAGGPLTDASERHAADLLATLHSVRGPLFGLERDTLIGSLHQPNPPSASWIDFFREHRLLHMAREAHRAGRLPTAVLNRIERSSGRLPALLDEPEHPSLIHGDVWSGNVLSRADRIAAFLDPAIYFAHPEIELAFITLFSTFGRAFFERYGQVRPIRPGFFETRRHVYNLYPLLVHTRLFGGGYAGQVVSTLDLIDRGG